MISSLSTKKQIIGVAQLTSINNKEKNLEVCAKLVQEAKSKEITLLCFPENCAFLSTGEDETRANAEPLDGPTIQRFRSLASENRIWISVGGFHEKEADGKHIHNTHVIINADGEIVNTYRKIHLFDINIPNGPCHHESKVISPGTTLELCDTPLGKLGLSVCYDLRFPEFYMSLREGGAQIILVPSAFTKVTGEAHWKILLQARAIETQCYVVAAAQVGIHNPKRETFGHSMIIDPWGTILSEIQEGNGLGHAPIDLEFLQKVRTNMPIINHRRKDLYNV